jgi:magnesium transporter
MSTPIVARGDTNEAFLSPLGLILTKEVLVTVRFEETSIFDSIVELIRRDETLRTGTGVFTALLEALVDRGADVLEPWRRTGQGFAHGFPRRSYEAPAYRSVKRSIARRAQRVGTIGDRLAIARDALLGLSRIAPFVLSMGHKWIIPEFEARLNAVSKDIASLNDFEGHVSNKVQFLLDAILGFIIIEQNDLFKVLTIVSVVGIPPTVVAGIYGMNFKFMPELAWQWGYPFGLALILLSALVPLILFKWRGWI